MGLSWRCAWRLQGQLSQKRWQESSCCRYHWQLKRLGNDWDYHLQCAEKYICWTKNGSSRENTDGSDIDDLAFVLVPIRVCSAGSSRGRRGRCSSWSGTSGGCELKTSRFVATRGGASCLRRWIRRGLVEVGITNELSTILNCLKVSGSESEKRILVRWGCCRRQTLLAQKALSLLQ